MTKILGELEKARRILNGFIARVAMKQQMTVHIFDKFIVSYLDENLSDPKMLNISRYKELIEFKNRGPRY